MTKSYVSQIIEVMEDRKKDLDDAIEILNKFALKENPPAKVFDALAVAVATMGIESARLKKRIKEYRETIQS